MKTTLFNRLTAGLLAAVLCLSVLASCAAKPQKELTRYSTIFYDVFDTVTQVIAYCESEEEFTKQMEALHADLISYNQLYDIYNDYDRSRCRCRTAGCKRSGRRAGLPSAW